MCVLRFTLRFFTDSTFLPTVFRVFDLLWSFISLLRLERGIEYFNRGESHTEEIKKIVIIIYYIKKMTPVGHSYQVI